MSGSGEGQKHHRPFSFLRLFKAFPKDKNVSSNLQRRGAGLRTSARAFPSRGPLLLRLLYSGILS